MWLPADWYWMTFVATLCAQCFLCRFPCGFVWCDAITAFPVWEGLYTLRCISAHSVKTYPPAAWIASFDSVSIRLFRHNSKSAASSLFFLSTCVEYTRQGWVILRRMNNSAISPHHAICKGLMQFIKVWFCGCAISNVNAPLLRWEAGDGSRCQKQSPLSAGKRFQRLYFWCCSSCLGSVCQMFWSKSRPQTGWADRAYRSVKMLPKHFGHIWCCKDVGAWQWFNLLEQHVQACAVLVMCQLQQFEHTLFLIIVRHTQMPVVRGEEREETASAVVVVIVLAITSSTSLPAILDLLVETCALLITAALACVAFRLFHWHRHCRFFLALFDILTQVTDNLSESGPWDRPTQSIMYVPLQVNWSQNYILLIVQYKCIKASGDFYSPESDPPHKIMRYWVYYSTQLYFGFQTDSICQVDMICVGSVPLWHFGGAGP